MSYSDNLGNCVASMVIPTYNGIDFIDRVLSALFTQSVNFPYEVVVIDSGSTDGTLEVLAGYPVKLIQIPKGEFGHGRTRNLGCDVSSGEVIIYLTQDAVPMGLTWLKDIVSYFKLDNGVQCVYARQEPRKNANPFIQKDVTLHFLGLQAENRLPRLDFIEPSLSGWESYYRTEGVMGFNSNVCSALRRSFLMRHPFPDVHYAEDQLMGRLVLRLGGKKIYAPDVVVEHSHDYPLRQYFRRYFDEYRGLEIALGYVDKVQLRSVFFVSIWATIRDIRYIRAVSQGQKDGLLRQFLWGCTYHLVRRLGAYFGGRHEKVPSRLRKILSLEARA